MLSGLLDEGAGPYDSEAFHRALDDLAVEISFHADHDNVHGQMKTLSRNIDKAFDLLRVAVCEPRLDAEAIDRVRSQIIAGLKHEAKDPGRVAGRAFRADAFPGHPYGRPTQGDLESVPRITRDDLTAMHRNALARDNLKIAAVGAIDAERLAALVDATFGALPAAASLTPVPDATPVAGARRVIDLDVPQSTIRFGLPGIARNVRYAVEAMGARRIGHGLQAIADPAVVELLASTGTVLELCLTSNILTGATEDFPSHPLRRLYEAGVRVTLNTDDPGIMDTDMNREYALAAAHHGFRAAEFGRCAAWAAEVSFVPEERKREVWPA
jgi:hypothetical protein